MSKESTRAAVYRWLDGLNSGDVTKAIAALAPNYVGHLSGIPNALQGPEAFQQVYSQYIRPAFPDQHITIEREVVADDRIAVQTRWTATHQGVFAGIPATGAKVTVVGTGIFHVSDQGISEEWLQEDFLGLWQQLSQAAGQAPGGSR